MAHRWNFDSEFCNEKLADLPGGSPERLKGRTQMKLKSSRGIVMKLICCAALVVLTSAVAFSATPKSGAMLEINGSVGTTPVDLKLYDSQIHSGNVQVVPVDGSGGSTCVSTVDNIPTDAYVLQGGAPTGCDPNDPYEVTDNNNNNPGHQVSGLKANFSGFRIETHYRSEPIVSISAAAHTGTAGTSGPTTYTYSLTIGPDVASGETIVIGGMADPNNNGTFTITSGGGGTFTVTNSGSTGSVTETGSGTVSNAVCNTSGKICASPDSGFLTVKNNNTSSFSGTISLTGTSTGCGAASDSFTGTLAISGSVTLALGVPGTVAIPTEIDSSNCGGFNQAQLLTLSPNVPKTAFFGKDDYQITTLNSATTPTSDVLSVLPIPVPAGPLGSVTFTAFPSGQFGFGTTTTASSPLRFSAGSDPNLGGTTFACVPYADFSADGNPVCAELQIECKNGINACIGFFYNVQNDFDIDGFSLGLPGGPGGIGGPAFLGHHQVDCPDSAFDQNIFLKYTPASVTFGDPLKGGGSGTPSCWVVAFDPSAATVTTGSVSSFTGFSGLFPPPTLNPVNRAQAVPLNFTFPTAGLHLCTSVNNPSPTCSGPGSNGAATPWVSFGTFPIDCGTGVVTPGSTEVSIVAGSSNLQTISSTPSLTSYRFNWKPQKTAPLNGCVVVVTQFSNGLVVFPDDFKYIK